MFVYVTYWKKVSCGCETLTLSVKDVKSLLVFERQVLRRTSGPIQWEEGWRIITGEINERRRYS
jgi:hypothetical protein